MKVHLFGTTSSPSCAAFSLGQAARDFGGADEPFVASTIERCMYVDDCLTSVSDVKTAIKLVWRFTIFAREGWFSADEMVVEQ